MPHDEISEKLKNASCEFFHCFSQFEFALKENRFLKSKQLGANAEPCWKKFKDKYKEDYQASEEASSLVELHPKRQVVSANGQLDWKPVGIDHCDNDLCRVIAMLTTIRNNLFHGGKYVDTEVDDKERNLLLLSHGKKVLDQLAQQFNSNNNN